MAQLFERLFQTCKLAQALDSFAIQCTQLDVLRRERERLPKGSVNREEAPLCNIFLSHSALRFSFKK